MQNTKQSLNTFRQLESHLFRNHRLVEKKDVIDVLKRAGIQVLNGGLLKRSVELVGKSSKFSQQYERMWSDDGVITVKEAIDLLNTLRDGALLNWDILKRAVEESESTEREAHNDRVFGPVDRGFGPERTPTIPDQPTYEEGLKEPGRSPQHAPFRTQAISEKPDVKESEEVIATHAVPMRGGKIVYMLTTEPSETLVVHCADPRFQEAFRLFITEGLGIPHYTPIVIGGGIHAFGVQMLLPKNFKILLQQIKFFVKEAKVKRIIFINHDDCQWYKKMKNLRPKLSLTEQEVADLSAAAERVIENFGGVDVRTFFAKIVNDNEVEFQELK